MLVIVFSILISLAASVAAAVVPLYNAIGPTNFLPNGTSSPRLGTIDPRFTATYRQGQERLSASSCLMSAVNAMMELALENMTEPISVRPYTEPGYPEVTIEPIVSHSRRRVEARFLLWGVWEGIRWMINQRSFRDLVIGAHWDGIRVSSIWIRGNVGQLSVAGGNDTLDMMAGPAKTSTHNATVVPPRGLSMVDARKALNDQHLTVSVTHVGEALGITEVFVAVFAALEYMAHFPSTDEVVRFQISPDDEDTSIGILEHSRAPASGPPFLEYQWVILAIAQIPGYMLQERRFTEVIIEILVNLIPIGEGFLSR